MSLLSRIAVEAARGFGMLASTGSPTNVPADYLVVAGGGGGGTGTSGGQGGGGAGGFQTSTVTLSTLNTYSITVGAGGSQGVAGSNSVLSGTGITTVTSIGGGLGASGSFVTGGSGGSGGGGSEGNNPSDGGNGGAGTSGQGNNGGKGAGAAGGGGGGASAVGANAAGSGGVGVDPGNGGNGTASSISGSSVTYAGGGGGSGYGPYTPSTTGNGGAGGGGDGASGQNSNTATAGTANTGGGGGAKNTAGTGNAAGGSGIVIISYTSTEPKFVGGTITTSGGNQIHTFTSSGTLSPITPITASYLVVAGGGSGTTPLGGGGGAGGLLTGSTTIYSGATYVITVGAGGASPPDYTKNDGSNSVISGTGLTTITSIGGGSGGYYGSPNGIAANNGGSGGGGSVAENGTPGAPGNGTSGQGNNGGTAGNRGGAGAYPGGGGGGGASAVGGNFSSTTGGNGGAGTASSISGTSTYYAGGGGGSGYGFGGTGTPGTGGIGGGGSGSNASGASGTANTGGGGGAGGGGGNFGGAGGSGIVIISYAGSQVFNGGLVTTSGGNTIHTFTSTGALTPLTNNLTNSLRFRSSASAYLTRSPTLTGNQKTWTWSAWVKRGALSGTRQGLFVANPSGAVYWGLEFDASNALNVYDSNAGGTTALTTTQVFRDPSAWYHINIAIDTTQATAANRVKLYINGNQVTAFSVANYPTQNSNTQINTAGLTHYIGNWNPSVANLPFDGYMTDINFIDGQALEPYYFGNNDANGVWKPILYKGTYGTNGFYLTFGNTTSTTTLGYDSSPNGNNWTCNNISLTAGTTYDAMLDVPTNTSATVANYCVLNPLDIIPSRTLPVISGGNLDASNGGSGDDLAHGTIAVSSGKWYFEMIAGTVPASNTHFVGWQVPVPSPVNGGLYRNNGVIYDFSATTTSAPTYTANDIIGCIVDVDAGKVWFSKNGTYVNSGDPVAGTNPAYTFTAGTLITPALAFDNIASTCTASINFGQRPFAYTPPTGFVALNTYNLPTPTILQGNKYMDATLWTGNGPASQVIVNQGQFKPDMVWVKNRSSTRKHNIYDSVRGVAVGASYRLVPNDTAAEDNPAYGVTSMNSNGFTIGEEGDVNANGLTFVGWQWQAGQGSTSSNTSGSITSTVSVNTTAGFSIVTYTANSNSTVGHGLGVAPKVVIMKSRTVNAGWLFGSDVIGWTNFLWLNLTNASTANSTVWNNTAPTSSVFTLGSGVSTANYGDMVAYCWAEIAGFSKFGSYTGNGSTDGPFVYLGFRPKFVLVKASSNAENWYINDSARDTFNPDLRILAPNSVDAEFNNGTAWMDLTSNGFKIRYNAAPFNTSGATYIYMAFAENPFKNSNAR